MGRMCFLVTNSTALELKVIKTKNVRQKFTTAKEFKTLNALTEIIIYIFLF